MFIFFLIYFGLAVVAGEFLVKPLIDSPMSKIRMSTEMSEDWEGRTEGRRTYISVLVAAIMLAPIFILILIYGLLML